MLTSCARTSIPVVPAVSVPGAALHGMVHGGQQPVKNSSIQLYAVGSGGDGSASTPLLSHPVLTDGGGNFNITGLYACPSASTLVYIVSIGGDPGMGANNPNLAEMAALGPCGNLSASTYIVITEVTTAASVYELAPYMTSYSAVGHSGSDLADITAAFAAVNELVDIATGTTPGTGLPSGQGVPVEQINTLADILASCVNSAGGTAGDPSVCGRLATYTGLTGQADTIAAMLQIARNPSLNTTGLYSLISPNSPFQPALASAPTTWNIAPAPFAAPPVISPNGGTYSSAQTITITDTTPSASIYYTIDGTTPTLASPQYSGSFVLSANATVKAFAAAPGFVSSSVASAVYTIAAPNAIPIIATVAGNGIPAYSGDGGAANLASVSGATGVGVGPGGTLYVADTQNPVIRKVIPGGLITTVAGNGTQAYTGDGGQATAASLNSPSGVAVDAAGDLFIADAGNHVVRKVAADGTISTYAGNGAEDYTGDGGQATAAALSVPTGVAISSTGVLYIADYDNNVIRKVTPNGVISTFAGTGGGDYFGDGGPATQAALRLPGGVAVDAAGNVFIAETENADIREVTPDGNIKTLAGRGQDPTSLGDGGPALGAFLGFPTGVAVNAAGDVFISDAGINLIRMVTHDTGIISTVAGTGQAGYSGDNGLATQGQIDQPGGVAVDANGNIFIADSSNNRIREVSIGIPSAVVAPIFAPPGGTYTTVTNVSLSTPTTGASIFYTLDGSQPTTASLKYSSPIALSTSRTINAIAAQTGLTTSAVVTASYVLNLTVDTPVFSVTSGTYANAQNVIIQTYTGGATIHYTADGSDPTASSPVYTSPLPIATKTQLKAIAIEQGFTPSGIASASYDFVAAPPTVSLPGGAYTSAVSIGMATTTQGASIHYTLDGSTPSSASTLYSGPVLVSTTTSIRAIAVLAGFTDSPETDAAYTVGALSPANNIITTIVGDDAKSYGTLQSMTVDTQGNVFFVGDTSMYKLDPAGALTVLATNGVGGFNPTTIYGMAVDPSGNIFYSASGKDRVSKLDPSGNITAVAGTAPPGYGGDPSFSGDGGPAVNAQLNTPAGIAFDASQNLYIADSLNDRIRVVAPSGTITSVAGNVGPYTGDGGNNRAQRIDGVPATQSLIWQPIGVAFDASGNWYIAEPYYNAIRKVDTSGIISTFNVGEYFFQGGGTYEGDATAVTVSPSGDVLIADTTSNRIRKVAPDGTVSVVLGVGTQGDSHVGAVAGYSGDGGPAIAASVSSPNMIHTDGAGNIYILDAGNNRIRKITVGPSIPTAGTPYFSIPGGTFNTTQTTSILTTTEGASIFYTTDGSTTTTTSTLYTGPIQIATSQTVKAIAVLSGFNTSGVGSAAFTEVAQAPTFSNPHIYTTHRITLQSQPNAPNVYYTIDGSTPTTSSTLYTGPFLATKSITVKAIATGPSVTASPVATQFFYYLLDQPTFSVAPGNYSTFQNVTISSDFPGAAIFYTTDGSEPNPYTGNGLLYNPAHPLLVNFPYLKAVAYDPTVINPPSYDLYSANAGIHYIPMAPVFSEPTGSYLGAQFVTITASLGAASVYGAPLYLSYTVDGSTPYYITAYTGPVTVKIPATATLRAVAEAYCGYECSYNSAETDATYTITPKALAPVIAPASGAYAPSQQITVTSLDSYPIHVTTDGSTPTVNSPLYLAPFTLSANQTVKAIAIGPTGSQDSDIASQVYTVTQTFQVKSTITTIGGTGVTGYSGDGGSALSGQFNPLAGPTYSFRSLGSAVANSYTNAGMAVDASGNVFFADFNNNAVRKITPGGVIATVAGTGTAGNAGINGPGAAAQLNKPTGVAIDGSGNVFISDTGNNRIVELTTGGTLLSVIQGAPIANNGYGQGLVPNALHFDASGNLLFVETDYDDIRKLIPNGSGGYTQTFPYWYQGSCAGPANGAGYCPFGHDLYYPIQFLTKSVGFDVLNGEYGSGCISSLPNSPQILTGCTGGFSGDGGQASLASTSGIRDMAFDPSGNLYILDNANRRVRKIDTSGIISTVVGNGLAGAAGDGGDGRLASLANPIAIAFDSHGNLYLMDGATIRKVTFQ
jgi:sugar lactone lactonase YvrE